MILYVDWQILADNSRKPTRGMFEWCRENPNVGIPVAVTGTLTVLDWNCVGNKPVAGRQLQKIDKDGYIADSWKYVPR